MFQEEKQEEESTVGPPSGLAVRIPFDEEYASDKLSAGINAALHDCAGRHVVVVCVGTDRSTGDAFGPIVGSKLSAMSRLQDVAVFGNLNEPVHAVNLSDVLDDIRGRYHVPPFIIAIDACLGRFDHVGHVILEKGPLRPGAGVKKTLPSFGDYTITGVVNVCGFMEYFVLQNTRLGIVMRMTDVVVDAFEKSWMEAKTQRSLANTLGRF